MFKRFRSQAATQAPRSERREVAVADRTLPLLVRENARSRRMTLRIEPGGRSLTLSIPPGLHVTEVERFLERQQGWLLTRLARFPRADNILDGGTLTLRGVEHRIRRSGQPRGLTRAIQENGQAILEIGGAPEHLKRRIRDFLKREAKRDLDAAVARHTATLGCKAKSVTLKDTRSRWGSCSAEGALSFSWRIVMAPPEIIDYLAAHEVAHLKEMNHGPRFWALCEKLCPHTETSKRWLKKHGSLLHAIDFD
jgi:predicted metal-dependent hydrolase